MTPPCHGMPEPVRLDAEYHFSATGHRSFVSSPCLRGEPSYVRRRRQAAASGGGVRRWRQAAAPAPISVAALAPLLARGAPPWAGQGKRTVTVVPLPTTLAISSEPPSASAKRFASGRPVPLPVYLQASVQSTSPNGVSAIGRSASA